MSIEENGAHCETEKVRGKVVGIGASAGGLKSLQAFFSKTKSDDQVSYVVIQHLSPNFPSHMDDLLGRHTDLAIHHAEDGMEIEKGGIYLMPSNKTMIASNGKLLLSDKGDEARLSYPIDIFLRSLATEYGKDAIAVILSGTGSDGTRGCAEIHKRGGFVICESAETAEFAAMPLSVKDAGFANYLLPPHEMSDIIHRYINEQLDDMTNVDDMEEALSPSIYDSIISVLQGEVNVDLSHYRRSTLDRRIMRRAQKECEGDLQKYVQFLKENPDEAGKLCNDLFIGVTEFFRDREAFEQLDKECIAQIIKGAETDKIIRIWVCGCATGEEAYTIAILFSEQMALQDKHLEVKIFATDILKSNLDFASQGVYSGEALKSIKEDKIQKYFSAEGDDMWRCRPAIRQMIVFAPHNVLASAPFTHLNLICCRNLLIYLNAAAQNKVMQLFHFGLKDKGYLFLGKSESIGKMADEFEVISQQNQIYQKLRESGWKSNAADLIRPFALPTRTAYNRDKTVRMLGVYDELLAEYMPPGFVVDEEQNLVHTFAGAEKFFQIKAGRSTNNALDLIHNDVRIHLARGLQQIFKSGNSENKFTITVNLDAGPVRTTVTIKRLRLSRDEKRHAFVTFDTNADEKIKATPPNIVGHTPTPGEPVDQSIMDHISELEEELQYTKENLQTAVEELEASNEELQATNEELTASNEELQSSNEELHSVNEELHTVNEELQDKNVALSRAKADLESLLHSTDIGVIYLDKEMKIRRFTPNVINLFDLQDRDVGRSLSSFNYSFEYPDLLDDIGSVLNGGKVVEREIYGADQHSRILRVLPYWREDKVDGVLLVFIDISAVRRAEHTIKQLTEAVESASDAIIATDTHGKVLAWNHGAEKMYGFNKAEAIGANLHDLIISVEDIDEFQASFGDVLQGAEVESLQTTRLTKKGDRLDIFKRMSPIRRNGAIVGVSMIDRDFTLQKKTINKLARKEKEQRALARLLTSILDNLPDMLFVFDEDGNLTKTSPDAESLLTNSDVRDKVLPFLLKCVGEVEKSGSPKLPSNFEGVQEFRFKGEIRHFLPRVIPILNNTDEYEGAVVALQDVTEFKMLDEVKSSLLGTVSHELKTPITSIRMAIWMTADESIGPLNDRQKMVLNTAREEVERLLRTTNVLLDLTRFEEGYADLNIVRMPPHELVRTVIGAYTNTNFLQHDIVVDVDENLPYIRVDRDRIAQAYENLIRNAIKFGPNDKPITTKVYQQDNMICFEVQDFGPGIPDEHKEKVFRKFYRVPSEEERSGSGLGLSIFKEFVQAHSGVVGVRNNKPRGSIFYFKLPIDQAPDKG